MKKRSNPFQLPGKLATTLMLMLFGFSFAFAQTPIPVNCTGGPASTYYSHIQFVTLEGENVTEIDYTWNHPGLLPAGTENQTSQIVELEMGVEYEVAFNLWATSYSQWTSNGAIWIDFNGDGSLTSDERVHWTPPGNTIYVSGGGAAGPSPTGGVWSSSTFTVPLDANPTNNILYVTMRAMQNETSLEQTNPCASYTWGAMIDFTVAILPADVPPPSIPISPLAVVITVLLATSFLLYRFLEIKKVKMPDAAA